MVDDAAGSAFPHFHCTLGANNSMTEKVYDGSTEMLRNIPELVSEGVKLLCPKCGAELLIAMDSESAAHLRMPPGIFCSRNARHFYEIHEIRNR